MSFVGYLRADQQINFLNKKLKLCGLKFLIKKIKISHGEKLFYRRTESWVCCTVSPKIATEHPSIINAYHIITIFNF
jgi:hypothetical protein